MAISNELPLAMFLTVVVFNLCVKKRFHLLHIFIVDDDEHTAGCILLQKEQTSNMAIIIFTPLVALVFGTSL